MSAEGAWDRALLAAALCLARPDLFGGLIVKAGAGPVLEAWLDEVRAQCPSETAPMVVPASVSPDRLHASLSVSRSLAEGRAIYQPGLLEDAAGRAMIVNGAERLQEAVAALLAAELDPASGERSRQTALICIDESREAGDAVSPILAERLAFRADLNGLRFTGIGAASYTAADIDRIRTDLSKVEMVDEDLSAVAAACLGMGVSSLQVPVFCMHGARAIAALERRTSVTRDDIMLACQLTLPGRGQPMPEPEDMRQPETGQQDGQSDEASSGEEQDGVSETPQPLESQIIEAIESAPVEMMAPKTRATSRGRAGVSG
ncbi:MAG: hypothetical protein WA989_15690, partial [Henriciella sp.]